MARALFARLPGLSGPLLRSSSFNSIPIWNSLPVSSRLGFAHLHRRSHLLVAQASSSSSTSTSSITSAASTSSVSTTPYTLQVPLSAVFLGPNIDLARLSRVKLPGSSFQLQRDSLVMRFGDQIMEDSQTASRDVSRSVKFSFHRC